MMKGRGKKEAVDFSLPELSLAHLKKLTDDTGLFQHAKFTVPIRECGYCTDDNARAMIVTAKYYAQYPNEDVLNLFDKYLAFTMHAQNSDGTIRNFMSFERKWDKGESANDTLGRVLWAMGEVIANPKLSFYLQIAKECFGGSVRYVNSQGARSAAYSIIGMNDYLVRFPEASDIKYQMKAAAGKIVSRYEKTGGRGWEWFENVLSYDNAVLPCALFVAGVRFKNERYLTVAKKTCEFLLSKTFTGKHFSFVGCKGWYKRGGKKAQFDQQPIEVPGTIMMLKAGFKATGEKRYLALAKKAFNWFLGENDLGLPVYNFKTKGCHDGLMRDCVNLNQGAESTLSFLLSRLEK
jgi:hypothetical protein